MNTTIVIPTYNEAQNLPVLIPAILNLPLPGLKILIVDDNSLDGTGQIGEDLGKEWIGRVEVLHRPGKMGLGTAYIQGFQRAIRQGAEAIGQMDADFSHPVEKIPEMVRALESCSVVLGSRYIAGGSLDERWPLWRKGLSSFGNIYAQMILGLPMKDITGGFRLWRSQTLAGMPLEIIRSNGYVFQVEMIYVANKLGYSFQEVPFHFADRRWGKSKMNMRIQIEAALRVWQLRWMYRHLKK